MVIYIQRIIVARHWSGLDPVICDRLKWSINDPQQPWTTQWTTSQTIFYTFQLINRARRNSLTTILIRTSEYNGHGYVVSWSLICSTHPPWTLLRSHRNARQTVNHNSCRSRSCRTWSRTACPPRTCDTCCTGSTPRASACLCRTDPTTIL